MKEAANPELREQLAADHGSKITDLPPLVRAAARTEGGSVSPPLMWINAGTLVLGATWFI